MEIELIEIRDFLARHAPFDVLPDTVLDDLPRSLIIRYLRRGSIFPPTDIDEDYLYIVRSGAIELRNSRDELEDKLGEGDLYNDACSKPEATRSLTGVTSEDTLLYLLECKNVRKLRDSSEDFEKHFGQSIRERLKQAANKHIVSGLRDLHSMTIAVGDLISKEPVSIDANQSIQTTAKLMMQHKVSSVMILEQGQLVGLVTDRDLRNRCIAAGLSVDDSIKTIMTANPHTLKHSTLLSEALLMMTRLHISHLPVIRNNQLAGMLAMSDLIRYQSANSAYLTTDISRAGNIEDLKHISQRIPELQLQLSNSSATAHHIGEAISCITDAITVRLIELAEQSLGPAPVPFVWLAGGSQARHEQTSHSDQDNALLIADSMKDTSSQYFSALADFVNDGLNACGYYYCPGDAMAKNPKWRQPVAIWQNYFNQWIDRPEPMALMLSSIFFDLRPVYGETSLYDALQQKVLAKTRQNRIFIAYMVANALKHRPPLGFFRNLVLVRGGEHDDTLDIKHRGVVPIVDIARVLALSEGIAAVNTEDRLRMAIQAGAVSTEMGENLIDGLEFIASLRIKHQAGQIRRAQKPDNYLSPDELSEIERGYLKHIFRAIQLMQETLANRYQAERFV